MSRKKDDRTELYQLLFLWKEYVQNYYFGFITENEQLSFAKATQLPAFLENEKQLLEEETKQLQYNRMLRDKQFRQLHEVSFRHCVCYSI